MTSHQNDICAQRRLRSAEEALGPWQPIKCTVRTLIISWTLIKLGDLLVLSCGGSYQILYFSVLRLSSKDTEKHCRMLIHAIQVVKQCQYKKYEFEKFVTITDLGETLQAFPVLVSEFFFILL